MLLEDRKAAYVSIRQHTSMPVRRQKGIDVLEIVGDDFDEPEEAASKVVASKISRLMLNMRMKSGAISSQSFIACSIRQHTSAYVSIRQYTSLALSPLASKTLNIRSNRKRRSGLISLTNRSIETSELSELRSTRQ
jgi:hypothetical protein